mgnify:CR=1 FL=1
MTVRLFLTELQYNIMVEALRAPMVRNTKLVLTGGRYPRIDIASRQMPVLYGALGHLMAVGYDAGALNGLRRKIERKTDQRGAA